MSRPGTSLWPIERVPSSAPVLRVEEEQRVPGVGLEPHADAGAALRVRDVGDERRARQALEHLEQRDLDRRAA